LRPGVRRARSNWYLRDTLSQVFGGRAVDRAFKSILDNPIRRQAIESQLRSLYPSAATA
jgi:hypothetical protein